MQKTGKSKFNLAVINLVKQMREARGLTQDDLAFFLDTTRGYIGAVESPKHRAKYNMDHLNRLAQEFKCSPRDFLPEHSFDEKVMSGRKKQQR